MIHIYEICEAASGRLCGFWVQETIEMAYTTAFQYEDCRIAQAWALKPFRRRPAYLCRD
jgi:hypothetical protein